MTHPFSKVVILRNLILIISLNKLQDGSYFESDDQSKQVVSSNDPWKTFSMTNGLNSPVWGPGALKTNTETAIKQTICT